MPKPYKYIDGALWKCCISQKDRECSKCGGPILKGQYYFYYKEDKDAYAQYRCHACTTPGVLAPLELCQTTIELPWTKLPKKEAESVHVNIQVDDGPMPPSYVLTLGAKGPQGKELVPMWAGMREAVASLEESRRQLAHNRQVATLYGRR